MAKIDKKTDKSYIINTLNEELEIISIRLGNELKELYTEYEGDEIPSDIKRKYLRRIKSENTLGKDDLTIFKELLDWAIHCNFITDETATNITKIIERPILYRKAEVQMKVTLKDIYLRLSKEYIKQTQ